MLKMISFSVCVSGKEVASLRSQFPPSRIYKPSTRRISRGWGTSAGTGARCCRCPREGARRVWATPATRASRRVRPVARAPRDRAPRHAAAAADDDGDDDDDETTFDDDEYDEAWTDAEEGGDATGRGMTGTRRRTRPRPRRRSRGSARTSTRAHGTSGPPPRAAAPSSVAAPQPAASPMSGAQNGVFNVGLVSPRCS